MKALLQPTINNYFKVIIKTTTTTTIVSANASKMVMAMTTASWWTNAHSKTSIWIVEITMLTMVYTILRLTIANHHVTELPKPTTFWPPSIKINEAPTTCTPTRASEEVLIPEATRRTEQNSQWSSRDPYSTSLSETASPIKKGTTRKKEAYKEET